MSELDEEAEDPVVELIVGSGEPERELAKLLMLLSTLCVDKEPTPDPSMRSPTTAPPARGEGMDTATCMQGARRAAQLPQLPGRASDAGLTRVGHVREL